jgi:hypothetical protein
VAERSRKLFYEGGIPEFAFLNERRELKGEKWAHRGNSALSEEEISEPFSSSHSSQSSKDRLASRFDLKTWLILPQSQVSCSCFVTLDAGYHEVVANGRRLSTWGPQSKPILDPVLRRTSNPFESSLPEQHTTSTSVFYSFVAYLNRRMQAQPALAMSCASSSRYTERCIWKAVTALIRKP